MRIPLRLDTVWWGIGNSYSAVFGHDNDEAQSKRPRSPVSVASRLESDLFDAC